MNTARCTIRIKSFLLSFTVHRNIPSKLYDFINFQKIWSIISCKTLASNFEKKMKARIFECPYIQHSFGLNIVRNATQCRLREVHCRRRLYSASMYRYWKALLSIEFWYVSNKRLHVFINHRVITSSNLSFKSNFLDVMCTQTCTNVSSSRNFFVGLSSIVLSYCSHQRFSSIICFLFCWDTYLPWLTSNFLIVFFKAVAYSCFYYHDNFLHWIILPF